MRKIMLALAITLAGCAGQQPTEQDAALIGAAIQVATAQAIARADDPAARAGQLTAVSRVLVAEPDGGASVTEQLSAWPDYASLAVADQVAIESLVVMLQDRLAALPSEQRPAYLDQWRQAVIEVAARYGAQ